MKVYLIFRAKSFWKEDRKKGIWYISNNGEIEFTYREAESYGITRPRFKRALAELVQKGLLDIVRPGLPNQKLKTLYAISGRWRKWGQDDFQAAQMKKRPAMGGFHRQKQEKPVEVVKMPPLRKNRKTDKVKSSKRNAGTIVDNKNWILFDKVFKSIRDPKQRAEIGSWFLHGDLEDHGIKTKIDSAARIMLVDADTFPVPVKLN